MGTEAKFVRCGCGCGFALGPGMYGRVIRGSWYAQGCIGPVRPVAIGPADKSEAPPEPALT